MAHTYTLTYFHVVFSTKLRRNLIQSTWEPELHAIFRGIARNKGFSIDC
jgi:REP element-mobilizing transposase RayT